MQTLSPFAPVLIAALMLCAMFLGARGARPIRDHLSAIGRDSESLSRQVFPALGYLALLAILLKLTLF